MCWMVADVVCLKQPSRNKVPIALVLAHCTKRDWRMPVFDSVCAMSLRYECITTGDEWIVIVGQGSVEVCGCYGH